MGKRRLWRYPVLTLLAVVVSINGTDRVLAVTSSSTHYQVNETQFNAVSALQSCSGQYCARASIGDTSAASVSATKTATFGSITDSNPRLEVIVESGASNLGVLTTKGTATKTTTVKVLNYLSSGYVLQILGDPPKYGDHTLDTLTSPTAASPGTEQFGINVVANTVPNVGANPVQVPSDQTSFGIVNDDYKTANLFKYASGDVVAHSTKASGRTDYTISMIVNISNLTPAGHYSGDFSAVVIPVY